MTVPPGALLREAYILSFRDGSGESQSSPPCLGPNWEKPGSLSLQRRICGKANLSCSAVAGWFPPSQADVTRRSATAHAPEPRVGDGGCLAWLRPPRRPWNWLVVQRAEGSQDRGTLEGLCRHRPPTDCAPSSGTARSAPYGVRAPCPARFARPLTAVAGSRLVEVGVALYAEAELGVALTPRALGAQDAAAVSLRLGHFVQGLVGEGQRHGQGQRQGQQRWTPAQPQGRRGQPHPYGPPTLCFCHRPSPRDSCPKGSPRKQDPAQPRRQAGAQCRLWRLRDDARLGLAAAELRCAALR